jgi:hypothetical protein
LFDAIRAVSGDLVYDRPAPAYPGAPADNRVKSMDLKAWLTPTANHRTIYQPLLRERVPDEWSTFDFPVPELVTGRRGETTVPTQALFLMNSSFIVEKSKTTAKRLLGSAKNDDELIRDAYVLILNRPPNDEEQRESAAFLKSLTISSDRVAAVATLCQTLFASAEFRFLY